MSRRSLAALLAGVLLVAAVAVLSVRSVGYVVFRPGPTVDVLGKSVGKSIIDVSGHRTYRDDGQLRLVTIVSSQPDTKVTLFDALSAWASPDDAVYPYRAVYQPADTSTTVKQESQQQMTSSQDNAVAAALTALKVKFARAVSVAQVDRTGPAAKVLVAGDRILRVGTTPVSSTAGLIQAVRGVTPGTRLPLRIDRAGTDRDVTVTTAASAEDPKQSALKVTVQPSYDFPFGVDLRLDQNIGGPSAGMMFALGIYDLLTPGSLTHGKVIAGTGEIDASGRVGEIGGIQQKLVGAQDDGARLFLVPAGNCAEALGGHYDPDRLRLVKVSTLSGAIADVKAWSADPKVDLPRCTR